MVDVVREPVLILDRDLCVMAANDAFYETFHVTTKDTEDKNVYQLGDGQWDIPQLHKLLDDILAYNTFFKGFQVAHQFPEIGRKVMILNGRQIYIKEHSGFTSHSPIILLAIEDVTEMMIIAKKFANHSDQIEIRFVERAKKMEAQIKKLEQEIASFKKRV